MRRTLTILMPLLGAVALSGCMDKGYGYGGVGYSAAWGDPYWGWYGDYYYPGTGIYIYDAHRHRHAWTGDQRQYWEGRRQGWHGPTGTVRNNWRDFHHRTGGRH